MLLTLGIETSCDETSVSIVKDTKHILSNVVYSSLKEHREFGGVIPEIAHRAHLETIITTLDEALKKAKVKASSLDVIAVTQGPGLMGSLLVGLCAAKSLSLSLNKPLVGVDHVIAHLHAGFLTDKSLKFPYLGLVVSGGHTMLLRVDSPSKVLLLGKTMDDAAGEAFDKVAKMLGLGYPGGPEVDRLSQGVDTNQIRFSRPFLSKDSLDFSFSGIKTAVFYRLREIKSTKTVSLKLKKAICAGFQEAVCEVLTVKTLHAAKTQKLKSIVVGGGVSANSRLRQMLNEEAAKAGLKVVFPSMTLCQDNAAMIAALGGALYREGRMDDLNLLAYSDFNHGNQIRRI